MSAPPSKTDPHLTCIVVALAAFALGFTVGIVL